MLEEGPCPDPGRCCVQGHRAGVTAVPLHCTRHQEVASCELRVQALQKISNSPLAVAEVSRTYLVDLVASSDRQYSATFALI